MRTKQLLDQLKHLQVQNNLMRKLVTPLGFFSYYFTQLPNHKTQEDCFNAVNKTYYKLFGEYRYHSFNSFKKSTGVC